MKRSLILMLSWVMLLALLCGCAVRETDEKTQSKSSAVTEQLTVTEQALEGAPFALAMTIAENETGCTAFEYRYPEQAYCFYAYDGEGNFYRVLWSDFDGLAERDRVSVVYSDFKKLTYTEYPNGGYTPAYEITATQVKRQNCLAENEDGEYEILLPISGQKVRIRDEQLRFVPYIDDKLVRQAEEKIAEQVSHYSDKSGLYLQVTEDYLCLVTEVIHYLDEPDENGFDHEHLFFSERISSIAVKEQPENVCELCGEETEISYFFAQTLSEDEAWTADISKCGQGIISERERKELMRIYNDRQRWTDDSFVDREAFHFDGFVHFAADGKCGRLYFGFEDDVLYFDGYFTQMYRK